jgi:xanthine dehydrogenase/oxidase
VGNTEIGIEVKFKGMKYSYLVNPSNVPECKVLSMEENGLRVGSAVNLEVLKDFIISMYKGKDERQSILQHSTRGLQAIRHMLIWFASTQIRNVACIGGNIVTASPISDMNPLLCALNAMLTLTSKSRGTRLVPITEFFQGYRKVDMQPGEVLLDVFIPFNAPFEFVVPLKQARRREDDISIVTSGMRINLRPSDDNAHWVIEAASLGFGGMAPTTVVAPRTADFLEGQKFCAETIEDATVVLLEEMKLPENVPGGQSQYRATLTGSFLLRSYFKICSELKQVVEATSDEVHFAMRLQRSFTILTSYVYRAFHPHLWSANPIYPPLTASSHCLSPSLAENRRTSSERAVCRRQCPPPTHPMARETPPEPRWESPSHIRAPRCRSPATLSTPTTSRPQPTPCTGP